MVFVILLLCMASGLYAQHKKTPYPNLAGKWVSRGDANYTLLVKNDWMYEYHKNSRVVDTFRYDITVRPCSPGKDTAKKSFYLYKKDKTGANESCYKLLSYSSNAFAMMANSNGATSHFIRYLKRY